MMDAMELVLKRTPEECYRAFCDVASSRLWLPGLKKARVVRTDEAGHALEVAYEKYRGLQEGANARELLSYALVYAYDDAARKVRWVPSAGVLDGVSGHAEFQPHADGCLFVYSLDGLRGRAPEHPEGVARAFAEWISRGAVRAP